MKDSNTTLVPTDFKMRLQTAFANLSAERQEWLLLRRYYTSDLQCSEALAKNPDWHKYAQRSNADFRLCHELLMVGRPDDIDDVLIDALTKSNALKALIEERKVLDIPWASDEGYINKTLGSAKASAMRAAIERVRGTHSTIEHIYTVEQVLSEADKAIEVVGRVVE